MDMIWHYFSNIKAVDGKNRFHCLTCSSHSSLNAEEKIFSMIQKNNAPFCPNLDPKGTWSSILTIIINQPMFLNQHLCQRKPKLQNRIITSSMLLTSDVLFHKPFYCWENKTSSLKPHFNYLMKTKVGWWIFIRICFCLNKRSIIIFHNGNQAAVISLNKSSNKSVRIWKKQTCCFWYKIFLLSIKFTLAHGQHKFSWVNEMV